MTAVDSFLKARDFLQAHREDYATAYREFRWPDLDRFNWALDYFDAYAEGNERLALWLVDEDGSEQRFTYDQMRRRSNQAANFLRRLGVKRGDSLLLMLDNVAPLWETMLAAMKLGAVIIPATTLLSPNDLRDRLERGRATHVVVGSDHAEKIDAVGAEVGRVVVGGSRQGWHAFDEVYGESEAFEPDGVTHANDPLLLYFTSGTTRRPKLAQHTHQSYPVGSLSTMYWVGLRPDDVHFNISSPGWAKHAWSNFFAPFDAGCTVFVYRASRFQAADVLSVIRDKGVTCLCAPPTVWRLFIQEDLAAYKTSLRALVGAGEPLNPEVIARVEGAWGLTIRDGYGQSETTAQIANSPGQPLKPGSMGKPMPGYKVALLDLDGNEVDEGEISLALDPRPLGLMQGYLGDEERTRSVMEGGYYRTGDVARRDEDGYFWYVGRADDVFKSSDYRVSPFELESILIEHEAVVEAAVVPSPDPLRLNVPKAYLVLGRDYEAGEEMARTLFAFVREFMSPYMRIRRLQFMELPKTISGKIRRVELRRHAASADRASGEFREEDFPDLGGE